MKHENDTQAVFEFGGKIQVSPQGRGGTQELGESSCQREAWSSEENQDFNYLTPLVKMGYSGIYCLTHRDTGRRYVGSSVNIRNRMRSHLYCARSDARICVSRAIRKLGARSFDAHVVCFAERSEIPIIETHLIAAWHTAGPLGFNTFTTATANYGHAVYDATRRRLSAANKGKMPSHQCKAAKMEQLKTWRPSPQHLAALIAGAKKKKPQGFSMKLRMANIGKKHSEESKEKMRSAKLGKKQSPEHIENARLTRIGKKHTAEWNAKISTSQKGKKVSAETKAKLSAIVKSWWANKKGLNK
jgi:group I intron endonuclease